ncbi:MAG: class I SAM-dependent methyltransferase [Planctomycetota bacterium]
MSDSPDGDQAALLAAIADRVRAHGHVPALDGPQYMAGHIAFEGSSDQQGRILRWLIERLAQEPGPSIDVLSIGAASGILDVPLLESVEAPTQVRYVVVEPFEEQCAAFEARARALRAKPNIDLEIRCETLAATPADRAYDLVLAIHSIYYVEDLEASLTKLRQLLRPGGELVIAVAPCEAMNQLAEIFWRPQRDGVVWFEQDVTRLLEADRVPFSLERIDAQLRMEPHGDASADIANFLVHSPLGEYGSDLSPLVLEYLERVGASKAGELSIPHPVSMIRVRN